MALTKTAYNGSELVNLTILGYSMYKDHFLFDNVNVIYIKKYKFVLDAMVHSDKKS